MRRDWRAGKKMEEAEDFASQPTRDPFAFVRSFSPARPSDQPLEACRGLENAYTSPCENLRSVKEPPFNELPGGKLGRFLETRS